MSLGARETETETETETRDGWMRATTTVKTGKRAIYLATALVERALGERLRACKTGLASVYVGSGGCALSVNENADPDVRTDLMRATTKIFGDEDEGDDATAAAMIGKTLDVPVLDGKLAFGTWQGVYLLEFEEDGGEREVVATLCDYGGGRATALRKSVDAPGRGCHLVTADVPRVDATPKVGVMTFFCQHTSASLTINENCDPDVRTDLAAALDRVAPEKWHHEGVFDHTDEGPDDMVAHVKTSLVGSTVRAPVVNGRLSMGTWQGVYLNEHRNVGGYGRGHSRDIVCVCDEADATTQTTISVSVGKRGLRDITDEVEDAVRDAIRGASIGTLHAFCEHTSASLVIGSADDAFADTFERALNRIVPESWNDEFFRHTHEGRDDMPGHVKSTLCGAGKTIPVADGKLALGPEHRLYLCEHRNVGGFNSGLTRRITLTLHSSS